MRRSEASERGEPRPWRTSAYPLSTSRVCVWRRLSLLRSPSPLPLLSSKPETQLQLRAVGLLLTPREGLGASASIPSGSRSRCLSEVPPPSPASAAPPASASCPGPEHPWPAAMIEPFVSTVLFDARRSNSLRQFSPKKISKMKLFKTNSVGDQHGPC